ncbi:MAG: hypothetical protein ACLQQB_04020 [Solirubrobacteraceae bacterium]
MVASRRNLIALAVAVVVLFVIAVAFDDNRATSADGIVWWVALLGLLLLIVLGVRALIQSRRSRAR